MPVFWKDGDVRFVNGDVRFVPRATELTINEPIHGLISSIPVLSNVQTLTIGNAQHGLVSGIIVLPTWKTLAASNTEHGLIFDTTAFSGGNELSTSSVQHGLISGTIALPAGATLTVNNAQHGLVSGTITFPTGAALEVVNAQHGLITTTPDFGAGWTLSVASPYHTVTSLSDILVSYELDVIGSRHGLITDTPVFNAIWALSVVSPYHTVTSLPVQLSFGESHNNTEHIIYDGTDYLRCKHQDNNLVGVYTSPVFDLGSAGRYLAYIVGQNIAKADIAVVGFGTTWDAQVPDPTTWEQISVSTNTWTNIFALDRGPSVEMRLYYGAADPPTNYLDKMEILSGIVTDARYFRVRITITDPTPEVYAYIEKYYLRLCQYGI